MRKPRPRWDFFLSLEWYDITLHVLFSFVAKTSEVLLAAGLIVSTANFLTDGSILATYPPLSTAWAWTQALAIDSSLGVSFSYAFQYFQRDAWVKAICYLLLTLLLALVAGVITTIDIASHALHIPMSDGMMRMGVDVVLLSQMRAIAVVGFILMSRLRDLPTPTRQTETGSPLSLAPTSGQTQASRVQTTIQFLCAHFNAQDLVEIFNACMVSKKMVRTRTPHNAKAEIRMDQQSQGNADENTLAPSGTESVQREPEPQDVSHPHSALMPVASTEPATRREPEPQQGTEPPSQWHRGPEPPVQVPPEKQTRAIALARVPRDEGRVQREPQLYAQLEHAYHSLVAAGKKPSGRALAKLVHIHRSTCVEWLRAREASRHGQPERDDTFETVVAQDTAVTQEQREDALAGQDSAVPGEPERDAVNEQAPLEIARQEPVGGASPSVSPDS